MKAKRPIALGIDIAKLKFDAALLMEDGKFKTKIFTNSPQGFIALKDWLTRMDADAVPVCMEATGVYYENLATFLTDKGQTVSVVNPAWIKSFGGGQGVRTKNDKVDACLIARYCAQMRPAQWQPAPLAVRQLAALGRRRDALVAMRRQELNRQETVSLSAVRDSICTVLATIEAELADIETRIRQHIASDPDLKHKSELLRSIPGVGEVVVETVLAESDGFQRFDRAAEAVAFIGLSPQERSSGISVRGRAPICKMGNRRIRAKLYMPALTAMRCNPLVRNLAERLRAKAKPGKVIICACMKKLVRIMFGVLKHDQKFDPAFPINAQNPA